MLLSLAMLMLSATQIYTIFTVQLLAVLNPLPVEANIVAVSVTVQSCIRTALSFLIKVSNSIKLPSLF